MAGRLDRQPAARWLRRSRLHHLLTQGRGARLTLLEAAAGSGKSALLARFADEQVAAGVPVVWLQTHPDHADPASLLNDLANFLGDDDEQTLLVVDDLHVIHGTAGEQALLDLIDQLPASTTAIAATRRVPAADLSAWRVAGELIEIGFEDLRFLAWEIDRLFRDTLGAPLRADEVETVAYRTDGWAAALQLLHTATRSRPPAERRRMITSPLVRWPGVRDYLIRTVLADIPADARAVLVLAGALGLLTGERCDELLERPGSGPHLVELYRRRVLLCDLASDSYRVPGWLADFLDEVRAAELGAERLPDWFRNAGDLLARDGELIEAVRSYARAEADDALSALLTSDAGAALAARPGRWLTRLPRAYADHPRVVLATARYRVASGDLHGAAAAYRQAATSASTVQDAADYDRERHAVEVWLESDPPTPSSGGSSAATADWSAELRAAIHADPGPVAARLLGPKRTTPAGRLAGAAATLLAGDIDEARAVFAQLMGSSDAHPAVPAVARCLHAVIDTLANPDGPAADALESAVADVERLDLPWMAAIAAAVADVLAGPPSTGLRLAPARDQAGDPWGGLVLSLIGGMVAVVAAPREGEPTAAELLEEAIARSRRLGAGVIEAWARAALAVFSARTGAPEARLAASTAEEVARSAGLPAAQAVACAALAMLHGTDDEDYRAAAEAYASASCASGPAIIGRIVGSPLDRPTAPVTLIGRDADLAELLDRYDDAAKSSTTGVVRIVGESGMGKSALLDALAERIRWRGGQVELLRAVPDGRPWALGADLVAALVDGSDADIVRLGLGVGIEELRLGAPDVDERRVREAVGRLVDFAARRRPLAVLIDDAHRVERSSLRLLSELVRHLRSLPLLVVVAYREDEITREADEHLTGPGFASVVRLDGLAEPDLRVLAARELGAPPPAELVAAVARLTGGAPGFVPETVARLSHSGPGRLGADALLVPAGIREVLVQRMARLSPHQVDVVRCAAVLGEPHDETTIATATGVGVDEVSAALAAATRSKIMTRGDRGELRFGRAAFSQVLASEVAESERGRYHRRAADHLEAAAGPPRGPRGPNAGRVAHHLLAARESNTTRLVRWVAEAAADAERSGDTDGAVALCQLALDQVGSDPAARGRLLLRMAAARRITGGDSAASGPFLAAVNAARAAGDRDLFARAVCGYARTMREFRRADEHLLPLLEEALAWLPDRDTALRAIVEARLADALAVGSRAFDRARDLSTRALDRSYRIGEPAAQAEALATWYLTLGGLDDIGARLDAGAERARYAVEAGDWDQALDTRRFRYHDLLTTGDVAAADIELAVFSRLAEQHPAASTAWRFGVLRSSRALLAGRFEEAERLADAAADAARPVTLSSLPSEVHIIQRLVLARETGALASMEPDVRAMVELRPEWPVWRAVQAWLNAMTGRLASARSEVGRILADGLEEVGMGATWLPAAWLLGETAVRVGDRDACERLYRALLPGSHLAAVVQVGVAVLGSVAKVLGELAAALGEVDDAVAHFEVAMDREIRLGSGPLLAWTKLAYGTTRLAAGGSNGRARGESLVADAIETASGYGMNGLLEAARAATPAANMRRSPRHTELSDAGSEARETVRASSPRVRPSSRLRGFGGFELELRGQLLDVRSLKPRVRSVLWVLAANAGRPVHAEKLIEALWPGVPADAGRRNLQVAISSLRQVLEPGVKRGPWQTVARDGDTYRLVLGDDVDADIRTFELAVAAARTLRSEGRLVEAADRFEQAVRAYGGELIPDAGPADWIEPRREGLRLAAADAAQVAAELRLELGEVAAARAACERGLEIDRYRDGLWRLLVRGCEADGDLAAAARSQRDYESVLAELGLPPRST